MDRNVPSERVVKAHTPLPPEQLKFRAMHGAESLSQLYELEVELVSESYSLDMKSLLGKPLTLEIETGSAAPRYLSGHITRCALVGRENNTSRYTIYRATVRPWLWYLTQTSDNKIFQNKSVPDVIREVLKDYDYPIEFKLVDSYRNWEYCVQYQETDYAFISRLMEHEGIYFWFKHDKGKHTLVLTDDITQHEPVSGYEQIPYYGPDRITIPREDHVYKWEVAEQITPGAFATTDYHPLTPAASLEARRNNPGAHDHGDLEMYEWHGGYTNPDDAEHYTRVRLEDLQCRKEQSAGGSNARGLATGHLFTLRNHPRQAENREYLVVSTYYRIRETGYASGQPDPGDFDLEFVVLPSSTQFRAPRVTPVPRTHGPQTATVVGKEGEEIWTDKMGRIKVQFHWDRYGKKDENSSCWVRVSSPWAGGGFGGIQLPRVRDEVIVDFIGGQPDRPIVIGRVFNANNLPPWDLPDNATQSGFLSRSKSGTPATANALMFEDKSGSERIWLHAERELCTEVEANEFHSTDENRSTTIGDNDTTRIGGNRDIKVTGTDKLHVDKTRDVFVKGHEEYTVKASRTVNVKDGLMDEKFDNGLKTTVAAKGEEREITGLFKETLKNGEQVYVNEGDSLHHVKTGMLTEKAKGKVEVLSTDANMDVKAKTAMHVESETSTMDLKAKGKIDMESTGSTVLIKADGNITLKTPADVVMDAANVKDLSKESWLQATPFSIGLAVAKAEFGMHRLALFRTTVMLNLSFTNYAMVSSIGQMVSYRTTGASYQFDAVTAEKVGLGASMVGLWSII
ncbi:type VI secretion system Vgr family protein [Achromobacter aegrifaciens]|uniref:type VI secretion system Vgr family protein n=1 Tax=Achromobacter aegrifaciens TaxID=1287736 RepID=UPI000F73D0F1|nr:type VI secretion system tip protein TssI/VgrG [Achromobacter aegrifaciens]RSE99081.1 type VI secretion system tip protein VgrG [Achromobacter aegrifaciens]